VQPTVGKVRTEEHKLIDSVYVNCGFNARSPGRAAADDRRPETPRVVRDRPRVDRAANAGRRALPKAAPLGGKRIPVFEIDRASIIVRDQGQKRRIVH
jgi:hypothetical protein